MPLIRTPSLAQERVASGDRTVREEVETVLSSALSENEKILAIADLYARSRIRQLPLDLQERAYQAWRGVREVEAVANAWGVPRGGTRADGIYVSSQLDPDRIPISYSVVRIHEFDHYVRMLADNAFLLSRIDYAFFQVIFNPLPTFAIDRYRLERAAPRGEWDFLQLLPRPYIDRELSIGLPPEFRQRLERASFPLADYVSGALQDLNYTLPWLITQKYVVQVSFAVGGLFIYQLIESTRAFFRIY